MGGRGTPHPAALIRARGIVPDVVEATEEIDAVAVHEAQAAIVAPALDALSVGNEALDIGDASLPLVGTGFADAAVVALLTGVEDAVAAAAWERKGRRTARRAGAL